MRKSRFIFLGAICFVLCAIASLALYDTKYFSFVPSIISDDFNFVKVATSFTWTVGENTYKLFTNSLEGTFKYFLVVSLLILAVGAIFTLIFRKANKVWVVGAVLTVLAALGLSTLPMLLSFKETMTLSLVYGLGGLYFSAHLLFIIFFIKYLIVALFVRKPIKKHANLLGNMTIGVLALGGLVTLYAYDGILVKHPGLSEMVKKLFELIGFNNYISPKATAVFSLIMTAIFAVYLLLKLIPAKTENKVLGAFIDFLGLAAVVGFAVAMIFIGDQTFKYAGKVFSVGLIAVFACFVIFVLFFRTINEILFGEFMDNAAKVQYVTASGNVTNPEDDTTISEEDEAFYQEHYGDQDEDVIYEEQYVDENGNVIPNLDDVYLDLGEEDNPSDEYVYGYESVDMDELAGDDNQDSQTTDEKSPFSLSDEEFAALEAEYADYLDQIPEKKVEEPVETEEDVEEVEEVVEEEPSEELSEDDEFEAFANSLGEKFEEEPTEEAVEEPVAEEPATEETEVSEEENVETEEDVEDLEDTDDEEDDEENLASEGDEVEEEEDEAEPIEKNIQVKEVSLVDEDGNVKRIKKRFNTKMMFAPYEAKEYYNEIKNYLEQYRAKGRISARCETFRYKGLVAKVALAGKSIKVCLALNPQDFENTKYHFRDVSAKKQYAEVPLMIKVRSPRSLKYFKELVDIMMANRLVKVKRNFTPTNYLTSLIPNGEAIFAQLGLNNYYLQESMNVKGIPSDLPDDLGEYLPAIAEEPLEEEEVEASVYVDTLCAHFNEGDVITLDALKELHLVTTGNVLRIKARGTLDRKLVIYAEYFDDDALKMLLCTNCTVVKIIR